MFMSYYTVKKIYPWLYSIFDPLGSCCYLAVGNDAALLYDTCYGIAPLRDVIREITDKPFTVVLGHGHVDHVNGAFEFEEAWLHEADVELFHEHSSKIRRAASVDRLAEKPENFDAEAYINAKAPKLEKLTAGQVFDLGGLHMDAIAMEGHTEGSISLLAREHRVLLDSDSANGHIWMFLPQSLPLSQYIAMLERTLLLDFDVFLTGHSNEPQPKSEMEKYIKVAQNASVEKSTPYSSAYPEYKGLLYQEGDVYIVFNERTLSK